MVQSLWLYEDQGDFCVGRRPRDFQLCCQRWRLEASAYTQWSTKNLEPVNLNLFSKEERFIWILRSTWEHQETSEAREDYLEDYSLLDQVTKE
ncbi:hypothetical protein DPMN_026059 [Dreissena polymorpha]|uniref:Uncharacterized protein n=1 Tax=Dreissena polymorpha TaxID=45954 RepID=A0A9D4LUG2_DREPO|nr:hypothetical protein DPMN_026059 [Dreissena polymorpha]